MIGPAPQVARALTLLEREEPDATLLDLNLNGVSAMPVAEALAARGIPFVLVTGYGAAPKEPVLRLAPRVDKPLRREKLRAAMARVLGR